jgi:hypothetical protein
LEAFAVSGFESCDTGLVIMVSQKRLVRESIPFNRDEDAWQGVNGESSGKSLFETDLILGTKQERMRT